jgi:hypothetical protein
VKSDAFALDLQALRKIKTETKWSDKKSVDFGGLAYAFCPDKLPQ